MELLGFSSILITSCLIIVSPTVLSEETIKDTREGDDTTLECRFNPPTPRETPTYYWSRVIKDNHDNAAVGNVPLDTNYRLNYHPEQGIYDLIIANTSYDRDNGRFDCRVKAGGSGHNLHVQKYVLTVLTTPNPPAVQPGRHVIATEGKRQELTCSSKGGSPDPSVRWYRDGSTYPMDTALKNGGSRNHATIATLSITPGREDDDATFRCEVRNRAMGPDEKLEAIVTLSVNYFPRVEVGPENPLRVERDSPTTLQCSVDAKPKVSNVKWTRNGRFITSNYIHQIHRVTIQDAGKYTCSADNGLGKIGEKEITLDVLYAPIVTLDAKTREAEEGESVVIKCNVTANPTPTTIEWVKDGKPDFKQLGDTLRLNSVTAEHSGTYICRAVNIITPTSLPIRRTEKVGNASIALLIRHKPGQARIMPDKPIATEGAPVTLTCTATPPGWPAPQYRWFRVGVDNQPTVVATGTKYTIANALIGNEDVYNCQATNELGPGANASVHLEVHQPPSFKHKLKPLETRRVGEPSFSISCSAKGKPKPTVKWLKDDEELTADVNMYEVKTEFTENNSGAVGVQSLLKFNGKARPNGNELVPSDRGVYTCAFENEVKKSESSMHLRIEHEPIILHQYNKVAYNIHETAEVVCKVLSYPKPEFKWFYGNYHSPLLTSSEGHYFISTTMDDNDEYTSVLRISNIKKDDYGEYNCQVINNLGQIQDKIRLQKKGAPEKPAHVTALHTGHNFVTLNWEPGFNGGIATTKYFVSYKKVPGHDNVIVEGCGVVSKLADWDEIDCQQNVPCNISHLDQHQSYTFRVKALNTQGQSESSHEITTTTRVDRLPLPQRVAYDPATHHLSINIPSTCLPLVAVVEVLGHELPLPTWQVVDTIPLPVSGLGSTYKEVNLDELGRSHKGRALVDEPIGMDDEFSSRVRVKFCLRTYEHCGELIEAELGPAYIKEASALATPTLIAIVVSCIVFLLFVGLLLMFCKCRRHQQSKQSPGKDYEMDSVRPTIVTTPQQNHQAPPPYYPSTGMENKALEHSLDLALAMEEQKSVYATQNGYGYHVTNPDLGGRPNMNNGDWSNMAYLENSYSNSNNGGSVNSQDSLWQMKMAAAASNNSVMHAQQMAPPQQQPQQTQLPPHHNPNNYGYDPLNHGGYGGNDDYATYPHLVSNQSQHGGDEYGRSVGVGVGVGVANDPYAAVHKVKKRMDQHIDSPYHDVSGLPDPYLEHMEDEKPPQHMSLNYEESLESGYSTPNSRTRRVIREIIV